MGKSKCLSVGLLAVTAAAPSAALTRHVSPLGDDANPGTADAPFASLTRARDALREAKAAADGPLEVVVHPGIYPLTRTFDLTAADAGTEARPVVFRAAVPGTARLAGSTEIPAAAFGPVVDQGVLALLEPTAAKHVVVADLNALGIPKQPALAPRTWPGTTQLPELFCDSERLTLARWPDEGWTEVAKIVDGGTETDGEQPQTAEPRGGTFQYEPDRPARWSVERGIWLRGYWCFDWAEDVVKVRALDADKHLLTVATPHTFGMRQGNPSPRRWYALNLLEELTRPGEFYLDTERNRLYVWPPKDLAKARLALSTMMAPGISLTKADHVTLRGLVVEEGGSGIAVADSSHVRIEACTVRNQHFVGITVDGGADNRILACDVHDTGTGGVHVSGGDRKTLTPAGHLVENCHIWKFAIHKLTYSNGISLSGVGNAARHNLLHDAPHMAVGMSGNDGLFEYNVVHHVCLAADDSGALYKGRNAALRGNVVRYNLWHSIGKPMGHGVAAIYFDDGDVGETVYGNLFFRCGDPGKGPFGTVFSHGGHELVADNNVFIECKRPLGSAPWNDKHWKDSLNAALWQTRLLKEVDITKPPYTTRYPTFVGFMDPQPGQPRVSVARRNLLVMCAEPKSGNWQLDDSNWSTDSDPGFVDLNAGNFNFRADAEVFRRIPGFEALPVDKMGLYKDDLRPVVPREPWTQEPPKPLPPLKQSAARQAAPPKINAPVVQVRRIAAAPLIDGALAAAEWGGLDAADAMPLAVHVDGSGTPRTSQAWLRYDQKCFYVAVRNRIAPETRLDTNQWGQSDAVEIAIRPLPQGATTPSQAISVIRGYGNGFLQFGVAPNGSEDPLSQEPSPCRFAASRPAPDVWLAEFAIPFSKIDIDPAQLPRCAFNISVRKAVDDLWLMWEGTRAFTFDVNAAGFLEWQK